MGGGRGKGKEEGEGRREESRHLDIMISVKSSEDNFLKLIIYALEITPYKSNPN